MEAEFGLRVLGVERTRHKDQIDTERSLVRVVHGHIVGTLCAYVLDICLPGGVISQATAVIDVGVMPEWRGSGIFRELMSAFLDAAHARHEPLAVLNADDQKLYPRFGFGVASASTRVVVRSNATIRPQHAEPGMRVEAVSDLEAASILPELFADLAATRLGEVSRTASWWQDYFDDAARGPLPTEFAVASNDGEINGYIALQLPDRPLLDAAFVVAELVAATAAAANSLIAYALGRAGELPLRFRSCPSDFDVSAAIDPSDVLSIEASAPQLWLRLVDVQQALSLRRYVGPARLVFDVSDEVAPWNSGRYGLLVDKMGAPEVQPSSEPSMFALGPAALASTFLGDTSFSELATAGSVVEYLRGSLLTADKVFATPASPFCSTLL